MTTAQLNAELFRQLSFIADDEVLLEKTINSIKRLRKAKAHEQLKPYTKEELNERIDHSMKSGFVSHEEAMADIDKFVDSL
jgi:hypothetical protein